MIANKYDDLKKLTPGAPPVESFPSQNFKATMSEPKNDPAAKNSGLKLAAMPRPAMAQRRGFGYGAIKSLTPGGPVFRDPRFAKNPAMAPRPGVKPKIALVKKAEAKLDQNKPGAVLMTRAETPNGTGIFVKRADGVAFVQEPAVPMGKISDPRRMAAPTRPGMTGFALRPQGRITPAPA